MNVISELGNELALAVLVEKKHREKINSQEALSLVRKVQATLLASSVMSRDTSETQNSSGQDEAKMSAH
jgi:hypothetical protein